MTPSGRTLRVNPKPAQDKPAGKVKLTKAMAALLQLMGSGWELRLSVTTSGGPPWLGRGREMFHTNRNTVDGLSRRKMITQHYEFPTVTYSLTPKGRRALKESSK